MGAAYHRCWPSRVFPISSSIFLATPDGRPMPRTVPPLRDVDTAFRAPEEIAMDFALLPEQEELVRTLRVFAKRELAPRSAQWDRSGDFPWDAWRKMGELGLLGLRTPTAFGGQEADLLTMGIASEEVARGDFSCTYGIQLAGLAGEILGKNGSDEIKARWLPSTARGDTIVALALTEPGAGSDAGNLACRAEREGDEYVITGEKSGISLGMVAQAAIVFARTAGPGARGVTAFLVPLDSPGVSRSPLRDLGTRAIARAVLSFDHVRVPVSHRVGAEGTGFRQVMQGFDYNRVIIALSCLGVAQTSLEESMAYVKERRAFGRALAQYEGVSFPIAEAATHIDACRWLCYRALWLADRQEAYTKESAMVKWWAPKLSVEVIHQCLLLHGHYGYTDELPFEQRLRDVIGLEIGDGTGEIMKVVVARELMGRETLPY
jgi:cyclohexanecarboxyl-CoA dehydrogenase